MGESSIKKKYTLGVDQRVYDFNEMFPDLPEGNIYIALSGGIESTVLLYIMQEIYPPDQLIACTFRFGDRRQWEVPNSANLAALFGIKHVEAGYMEKFARYKPPTPLAYFNRENGLFDIPRTDPKFVAGFTGKNTTTLDPEIITPEEQQKYLIWYNVHRPFLTMNKTHTVDLFYKLNIEDLLQHTYSCQRGGSLHCGDCHACWERIDAFNQLGRKDPAIYEGSYSQIAARVNKQFKTRWLRS